MKINIVNMLRKCFRECLYVFGQSFVEYNQQNDITVKRLVILAWVATVGMPLFYVVWTYWFPQPYENIGLRILGVAICLPAIFASHYSKKKWLPAYFFIGLTYVLPFFFTFMYFMNKGSLVWSESLLIAIILLFHFDSAMALLAYIVGTIAAYLVHSIIHHRWTSLNVDEWAQLIICVFAIITVTLTKIGSKVLLQKKLEGMSDALATVAHELRTPLLSIKANIHGIQRIANTSTCELKVENSLTEQAISRVEFEVGYMNTVIDLLVLNASNGRLNLRATEILSIRSITNSVLNHYHFIDQAQRELVSVKVRSDFFIKGDRKLFSIILLNLLSNSFKAIHRAGKGRIRIVIDGSSSINRLLFIDTGSGISSTHLPHVFRRFFTYPKHAGTGIGLSFCKEVMEAWGGGIHCSSKIHSYTIFVLEFPSPRDEN